MGWQFLCDSRSPNDLLLNQQVGNLRGVCSFGFFVSIVVVVCDHQNHMKPRKWRDLGFESIRHQIVLAIKSLHFQWSTKVFNCPVDTIQKINLVTQIQYKPLKHTKTHGKRTRRSRVAFTIHGQILHFFCAVCHTTRRWHLRITSQSVPLSCYYYNIIHLAHAAASSRSWAETNARARASQMRSCTMSTRASVQARSHNDRYITHNTHLSSSLLLHAHHAD